MDGRKTAKIIFDIIYCAGVAVTLCLIIISVFGADKVVNPNSMLLMTWQEIAFCWLAIGSGPMIFACVMVYKFNDIKNSTHKKRNFIFIFLPGLICLACVLFVIGVVGLGMINTFFNH